MKKYIYLLIGAALFVACEQKETTVTNPPTEKKETNTTVVNPPSSTTKKEKTEVNVKTSPNP
jgi:PBP1b-binding outer membrane lipoprotein LpoB